MPEKVQDDVLIFFCGNRKHKLEQVYEQRVLYAVQTEKAVASM